MLRLSVTETLSDGLGRMIMDEEHEERRQRIRKVHSGSSGDHLVAGLKGFGFGLLGGATSLLKHTYEGAYYEGFQVLSPYVKLMEREVLTWNMVQFHCFITPVSID
jgi:hypothetical protein